MRNQLITLVAILGAATMARAETLYLNSAQTQTLETQTEFVDHAHDHVSSATAGCRACGSQSGAMGQYPGGCCERDASCCASLWANYCDEKKPCWTPESPRRHSMGLGIPIPSLPSLHCGWLHHKCGAADSNCDDRLNCDTTQCDASAVVALPETTVPAKSEDSLGPVAPEPDDLDSAARIMQPVPVDVDSAKRTSLPFGWKLPKPKFSNPFKSSPTARLQLPFSR